MKQFKGTNNDPSSKKRKQDQADKPSRDRAAIYIKEQQTRRSESLAALTGYLVDHMMELDADLILMHLRKLALATPEDKKVKAAILTAIGRIEATLFHQGCILAYQVILLVEPIITNLKLCHQSGLKILQKFQSDFEEGINRLDYKV